jgi:Holliday junction resolvase RusA-like endonuclease
MSLILVLHGQPRGGKNNYIVLRNGMHVPRANFKKWRDDALSQIKRQIMGKTFSESTDISKSPIKATIWYWKGDLRRRDVPAIEDAIFHVLERSGIVADDCLIEDVDFKNMGLSRENPKVEIRLEVK